MKQLNNYIFSSVETKEEILLNVHAVLVYNGLK